MKKRGYAMAVIGKGRKQPLLTIALLMVLILGSSCLSFSNSEVTSSESPQETERVNERSAFVEAEIARESVSENDVPQALAGAIAENPDICAWLCVPKIGISVAVARCADDDSYYITHDSTGAERSLGAVYMESLNTSNFTDPVTVLYGHSFEDVEVLLTGLHRLENPVTFNDTKEFYVYLPDKVLVYRLIAACQYDDEHLLSNLNMDNKNEVQALFDEVVEEDPATFAGLKRRTGRLDAEKDRIVQLSTCTLPSSDGVRFVVTGVLEDERLLDVDAA